MGDAVRVLIVDDSVVFRDALQRALSGQDGIAVIGSARNGVKALESIAANRPDLVTLDIEMPEMDGLATLERIRAVNAETGDKPPIGVIMLSSHTRRGADITIRALEQGAFDFVTKPDARSEEESIELLRRSLVPRIHHFALKRHLGVSATLPKVSSPAAPFALPAAQPAAGAIRAVLIGVSTGGPKALSDMMPDLCRATSLPVFIVQHMPPSFTASLAESLQKKCFHRVKEGENGETVEEKTVYIAPGGRHMVLRQSAGGRAIIGVHDQPPENGCRPSVDVLFRSAPGVYGGNLVAIIMTGMGNDGSASLRAIKRSGGTVIVQDEATSVVWGMPGAATATGFVDRTVPLMEIPATTAAAIQRTGETRQANGIA